LACTPYSTFRFAKPEDDLLTSFAQTYWDRLQFRETGAGMWSLLIFVATTAVTILLSLRVNINEFSLHYFYKNRLVRCYLGASSTKTRVADSFTGFDPQDDILLKDLRCATPEPGTARPLAPFPIVNATLNITAGTELATQ
jgi:hypothetical protein